MARLVRRQLERGINKVTEAAISTTSKQKWLESANAYMDVTNKIIYQTECRVLSGESVPSTQKIVSIFEAHSDIIVKGNRKTQYGHKINISSDKKGLITSLSIESGNPSDIECFIPTLEKHIEC